MFDRDFVSDAMVLKAFGDEKRLIILNALSSGEKCAGELLDHIDIGQSTLSHHMKILSNADIVKVRRSGKWTYYSINKDGVKVAKSLITDITTTTKNKQIKKVIV